MRSEIGAQQVLLAVTLGTSYEERIANPTVCEGCVFMIICVIHVAGGEVGLLVGSLIPTSLLDISWKPENHAT